MRAISLCLLTITLAIGAWGQEFEAAIIKPNKSGSNGSSSHSNLTQFLATNVNLRSLIVRAYGVKDYQVEGPEWLRDERFDVAAKYPAAVTPANHNEVVGAMMRKLLEERFKLAVHRETRNLPVYGLVVDKGGIKAKEVPDNGDHGSDGNNNHYVFTAYNMASFAEFVSRRMDQPVLDMTGLKAYYDMTLDLADALKAEAKDAAAPDPSAILATALREQLGLKLEPRKAPIEIVVVDHAEKVPVEN